MKPKSNILLVEDNEDDVELARAALAKHNVTDKLVVASDGAQALDYLFGTGQYANRDMSVLPSLILLDLKLPKISGLDVLRSIRDDERTKLIPVIVLTSSESEIDLIESYRLGCNSYLRKPTNFGQFMEDMGKMAGYWLELNKPPPAEKTL